MIQTGVRETLAKMQLTAPPASVVPVALEAALGSLDDSAALPQYIFAKIPKEELPAIESAMSLLGFTKPNWPCNSFAAHYLSTGCQEMVRSYCIGVRGQLETQLQLICPDIHSQKANEAPIKDKRRLLNLMKTPLADIFSGGRSGALWNEGESRDSAEDIDLALIFPEFKDKVAKDLLAGIEAYPEAERDREKGDWVYWYYRILGDLKAHDNLKANYILLRKAGPTFSTLAVHMFKFTLREMNNERLAFKLGARVYQYQGKNPVQIAPHILVGKYGCSTQKDVYHRTVAMMYCRYDDVSTIDFVRHLYRAIIFKVPEQDRERLYSAVATAYGSVDRAMKPPLTLDEIRCLPQVELLNMQKGIAFPSTYQEIRDFARYLVLKASEPSHSSLEASDAFLSHNPRDPVYGLTSYLKQPDKKVQPPSTPSRIHATYKFEPAGGDAKNKSSPPAGPLTPTRDNKNANKPDGVQPSTPGTGGRSKTTPRPKKYCSHCEIDTNHTEATCWLKHPELKAEFTKKMYEKRQQKREEKFKGDDTVTPTDPMVTPSRAKPKENQKHIASTEVHEVEKDF